MFVLSLLLARTASRTRAPNDRALARPKERGHPYVTDPTTFTDQIAAMPNAVLAEGLGRLADDIGVRTLLDYIAASLIREAVKRITEMEPENDATSKATQRDDDQRDHSCNPGSAPNPDHRPESEQG